MNISQQHASIVESSKFWPEGVICRKWQSFREWSKICNERTSEENGYSHHDDVVKKITISVLYHQQLCCYLFYCIYSNSLCLIWFLVLSEVYSPPLYEFVLCWIVFTQNFSVVKIKCNSSSEQYVHPTQDRGGVALLLKKKTRDSQ